MVFIFVRDRFPLPSVSFYGCFLDERFPPSTDWVPMIQRFIFYFYLFENECIASVWFYWQNEKTHLDNWKGRISFLNRFFFFSLSLFLVLLAMSGYFDFRLTLQQPLHKSSRVLSQDICWPIAFSGTEDFND